MSSQTRSVAQPAPHSWDLEHWPESVYPHTTGRARYMLRAHRAELTAAGALSRVGREIIVLGAPYTKWLQSGAANVSGFEVPANRSRMAKKNPAAEQSAT